MAMSNSGGNPDLQNFKKAVDKGDYFEIISQNKLNAGNGVYKVYKTGEVEYKNDKYSQHFVCFSVIQCSIDDVN